jgi:hypothetical protein
MIIGTSQDQIKKRTGQIMNDTISPMKEEGNGSRKQKRTKAQKKEEMEPWDIAPLLICQRGEDFVDVENATDAEFDAWVKQHKIPVDNDGHGDEWEFDDRCGVINYAVQTGRKLKFLEQNNSTCEIASHKSLLQAARLSGVAES